MIVLVHLDLSWYHTNLDSKEQALVLGFKPSYAPYQYMANMPPSCGISNIYTEKQLILRHELHTLPMKLTITSPWMSVDGSDYMSI